MTSNLDRLYRFFRHDDEENDAWARCSWNVAAGALEQTNRLYRILYIDPAINLHIEDEITIDTTQPTRLFGFLQFLQSLQVKKDLDPAFLLACADLLAEDPWLSLIKNHQ